MYCILFNHLSIDGDLQYFNLLAIVNNTDTPLDVKIFLWDFIFGYLGLYKVELVDYMEIIFNFL